ncbi:DUF1015 family protein [Nocardioides jishulii]|uniref:DUF1015 domain-containing protein n=1 Tax=Nocardioides jishulii TaxID=2575440 RepID=A0A4U2YLP4_9ACTN|nr:DUF1015 family protein [Nocardioides jishulii]QCX27341.1 DUF1015 family protein [Nocardioides jishulii]TKI62146.1 DUF1015 domain-containing protein [Nocardioides jishulii]
MHENGDTPTPDVEIPASPAHPVELRPFRGVRLSPQKVANPSTARAFARPYRDVATRLSRWQDEGLVELDLEPALYLHEYSVHGMTIRGLVGGLQLSTRATHHDERSVFAHEAIHPEQADELAARMYEMGMNPGPILLVHRGPATVRALQRRVMERQPDHAYTDRSGQEHRLWRITDEAQLQTIAEGLSDSRFMIADGHHRYAAYLRLQEMHPGTPWDRGLTMVVDQEDTPFFLGPIHRTFKRRSLLALKTAAASVSATTREVTETEALRALGPKTLVATDGRRWMVIDLPEGPRTSAVEFLHQRLLPTAGSDDVVYHHSVEEAITAATASYVSVLLPAPDYSLLDRAMERGHLLPEKATSFQPKPSLGVLMRSVDSELMAPPSN